MTYKLFIIIILTYFICRNLFLYKKIKRKIIRKKMEVDNNIKELVIETNKNIQNNKELKIKKRKVQFMIIINYSIKICLLVVIIVLPILYMIYLVETHNFSNIDEFRKMEKIWLILIIFNVIILFKSSKILMIKKEEYKGVFKEEIFNTFFKNLNCCMKLYKIDENIKTKKQYIEASFKKVNLTTDLTIKEIKKLYFEDYMTGIYNNFLVELADCKKIISMRKIPDIIQNEGIFCSVTLDKIILNSIRITNNKYTSLFYEKEYTITTMSEEFYNNFRIIAQNSTDIKNKIDTEIIQEMQEFYNNTKIKFNISIIKNKIYFEFLTTDYMEPRKWGKTLDNSMLEEYGIIMTFILEFSKKIYDKYF